MIDISTHKEEFMRTLMRNFGNIFTRATSRSENTPHRDVYREWSKQRELASQFGPHHVSEIDAIFSRNGF